MAAPKRGHYLQFRLATSFLSRSPGAGRQFLPQPQTIAVRTMQATQSVLPQGETKRVGRTNAGLTSAGCHVGSVIDPQVP